MQNGLETYQIGIIGVRYFTQIPNSMHTAWFDTLAYTHRQTLQISPKIMKMRPKANDRKKSAQIPDLIVISIKW